MCIENKKRLRNNPQFLAIFLMLFKLCFLFCGVSSPTLVRNILKSTQFPPSTSFRIRETRDRNRNSDMSGF